MRPTWLVFMVEDRLRIGLGEGKKEVRHRDTCFERIKKFLTILRAYIIITAQEDR